MPTIRRKASYRIITRAVQHDGEPITGLLPASAEDIEPCSDGADLQARLRERPEAIVVYNQHPAARALVESLDFPPQQVFIEIRQDTKGVLGLHAMRRDGAFDQTLELIYQ